MKVDKDGNVIVDAVQPLQDINNYFHQDFDDVAHDMAEQLSKGDEDDEMAERLGYG